MPFGMLKQEEEYFAIADDEDDDEGFYYYDCHCHFFKVTDLPTAYTQSTNKNRKIGISILYSVLQ